MRLISMCLVVGLALGACQEGQTSRAAPPAEEASTVSIKADQAVALINAEVETLVWDGRIEGGHDRGTLEIEMHSLDGPWRWWSRQRRTLSNGDAWSGIFGDAMFVVPPASVTVPVEVVQGASDRWDVVVTCHSEPCIRMTGSQAQAQGARAEVEAALDAPIPVDEQIEAVFFPFASREQAERVARSMNELLELQGARRVAGSAASAGGTPAGA